MKNGINQLRGASSLRGHGSCKPLSPPDMSTKLSKLFGMAAATLAFVASAGAVPFYDVSPSTPTVAVGTNSSQPSISDIQTATGVSPLTIAYKKDAVTGTEGGSYKNSYSTTFQNSANDPSGALIEYNSGPVLSLDPLFLLVKDGDHNPYWYLFNISSWNGTDTIRLTDFWPNQGAISNLVIYAGNQTSVPDGATTALLLGIVLLSVGMAAPFAKRVTARSV